MALRLRMREEIDFDAGIITSYGYEVYQGEERLYWYDDFPPSQRSDPRPQLCRTTNTYRRTSNIIGFLHRRSASTVQTSLCSFGRSKKWAQNRILSNTAFIRPFANPPLLGYNRGAFRPTPLELIPRRPRTFGE